MSEGLAQGIYVATRAAFEAMTLRTKGVDTTNAPPTPQILLCQIIMVNAHFLIQQTIAMCLAPSCIKIPHATVTIYK